MNDAGKISVITVGDSAFPHHPWLFQKDAMKIRKIDSGNISTRNSEVLVSSQKTRLGC